LKKWQTNKPVAPDDKKFFERTLNMVDHDDVCLTTGLSWHLMDSQTTRIHCLNMDHKCMETSAQGKNCT
jgi:hypothetical protein